MKTPEFIPILGQSDNVWYIWTDSAIHKKGKKSKFVTKVFEASSSLASPFGLDQCNSFLWATSKPPVANRFFLLIQISIRQIEIFDVFCVLIIPRNPHFVRWTVGSTTNPHITMALPTTCRASHAPNLIPAELYSGALVMKTFCQAIIHRKTYVKHRKTAKTYRMNPLNPIHRSQRSFSKTSRLIEFHHNFTPEDKS